MSPYQLSMLLILGRPSFPKLYRGYTQRQVKSFFHSNKNITLEKI